MKSVTCFNCDDKGKIRNEFGMWEKCGSCQKNELSFETVNPEPDINEEGV